MKPYLIIFIIINKYTTTLHSKTFSSLPTQKITHTHTHARTLAHTRTLTHALTHALTHTHTHTHTELKVDSVRKIHCAQWTQTHIGIVSGFSVRHSTK